MIDFCADNGVDISSKTETVAKQNRFSIPLSKTTTTIIAPDSKDNLIETFLANKGIKFNKLDTKELLKKNSIESRIENAPKDMKLVHVDSKKLEELISNQDNNIEYCKSNYDDYYKDCVNLMMKSGDKIPATTLYIMPTGESADDTVNYIKTFGADRLNDNQISFMFNQRTDDPDHCTYFGMKDVGMDKIPVYVDKDSYKVGSALGLFK